jgi:hypothetical protein
MVYACPTWEYAADARLFELQRLQIRVFCAIDNFDRHTSVREMKTAVKVPYMYDYKTKLCSQQTEVIQNRLNQNVRASGQGVVMHRKCK